MILTEFIIIFRTYHKTKSKDNVARSRIIKNFTDLRNNDASWVSYGEVLTNVRGNKLDEIITMRISKYKPYLLNENEEKYLKSGFIELYDHAIKLFLRRSNNAISLPVPDRSLQPGIS